MKMRVFLLLCVSILICSCESEENNNDISNINDSMISSTPTDIKNDGTNDTPDNCTLLNISDSKRDELLALNNTDLSNQVFTELNKYRTSQGKKELIFNENLLILGIQHNQYQISQDDINHDFGNDRFCSISSVLPIAAFAENTAFGFDTAEKVLEALLESPNHKKNIEGDFDSMATAVSANEKGVLFYTQIFIKLQ